MPVRDLKQQAFSLKKILCSGLALSLLVMLTCFYYGSSGLTATTTVTHEIVSSIIRSSSVHKDKRRQHVVMNMDPFEEMNQSTNQQKNYMFDISESTRSFTGIIKQTSPPVVKYRDSAEGTSLMNLSFPAESFKHAPVKSGTFQGSTGRASSTQGRDILTKGSSAIRCTPRTNIVFFKMHKCSSSTVQNILMRFGEERELDFVLPPVGSYLGHSYFKRSSMIEFPVKEYNIICHHTMFNRAGMDEVMPSNTVYISILRDPVPMFESIFTYQGMAPRYHLPSHNGLKLFLERPEVYYRMGDGGILHARNPMLFNLGLPKESLGDVRKIEEKIDQLKTQFDLVMMTDYFEESLILLRDLMCWEMDDIVYFVLNARSKSSVKAVSPTVGALIRKWNYGDVRLFETFNQTFWRKVKEFGEDRMREEVSVLRMRNEYFSKHCISQVINKDPKVWHPPGIDIDSFKLRPEALTDTKCTSMARTELPYTERIRRIQLKRYGM